MHPSARNMVINIIALLSFLSFYCSQKEAVTLRISGSTTIKPYIEKIVREYKIGKNIAVNLYSKGSISGIDELIAGTCDIAMSSTELLPEQVSLSEKKGVSLKPFLLGYDIIIPIVNPENRVSDITLQQLKNIYSKKIQNWSELGWKDTLIEVISRDTCSGTFDEWNRIVVGASIACEKETAQPSNSSILAYVSKHANAIGYISHVYLNPEVKPLQVNGLQLSDREKLVEQYPIKRPLFLYVNKNLFTGEVKKFITFLLMNEKAEKLFTETGFFPEFYARDQALPGD